jgi:hypothetical protein
VEFGSLTSTVDIFEAVLGLLLLLLALPATIYNVREAWGEKERALDDPKPSMRRLGLNRYDNARLLLLTVVLIALGTLSALLVPSAVQIADPLRVSFRDVLNAVVQRVVFIGVVLAITYQCVNDAVWRQDVDRRWREGERYADPVVDAAAAVALGGRLEAGLAANTALTEEAAVNTANTQRMSEAIHTLVNSNMGEQLRISAVALRRIAETTREPRDAEVAAEAERALSEHLAQQEEVDSRPPPTATATGRGTGAPADQAKESGGA